MNIDKVISVTQRSRATLLKQPGVVGVGHGWTVRSGKRTSQYAIVVYVVEKRPLAQLPREQRIPVRIGGVPTDYDRLTPLYDPLVRWTLRGSTFKRNLMEQAKIESGHRVLDLGWGTATLTLLIMCCDTKPVVGAELPQEC